jgi:ADP-ribosylglycohydrolase
MAVLNLLDRGRGCLLGLAIGDALGAPLEGLTAQQVRTHYGVVSDYVDGARAWKRKPLRWRSPGLYTDDTQQALVMAEVLLDHGRIDPRRVADLYLALAQPPDSHAGAHRGVGRSFHKFLKALSSGTDPRRCGQDSAGITATMRVAPLALYLGSDLDRLVEAVTEACLMTHLDVRSLTGALAVAFTLRRLLEGEERSPALLFRVAGDLAQAEKHLADRPDPRLLGLDEHGRSMSACIARTESFLDLPRDAALTALVDQANRHGPRTTCRKPTMGFPPACIPTCLYLFLACDSFEEAMIDVVNLGGDADSAGALVGALAGAHYGIGAVPDRWLTRLQNREGIELRAEALLNKSRDGLAIPNLVETERKLSRNESVCRQGLMIQNPGGNDLGSKYRR